MEETPQIPLEKMGEAFLSHVVTVDRIKSTIMAGFADKPFEIGPVKPLGPAPVTASGRGDVTEVSVGRIDDVGHFDVRLHLDFELKVVIAGADHRYKGDINIVIHLHVIFEEPLVMVVDIEHLSRGDVSVEIRSDSGRAELVKLFGNIRSEVRRQVIREVRKSIESDAGVAGRRIDIAASVDDAWDARQQAAAKKRAAK